jgi:hypothetical protein
MKNNNKKKKKHQMKTIIAPCEKNTTTNMKKIVAPKNQKNKCNTCNKKINAKKITTQTNKQNNNAFAKK